MKVELYGFEKILKFKKQYIGFTGIKIFDRRFLGFSIFKDKVVVNLELTNSKTSSGIWIYIFFYNICIEFKYPWKDES